jgi:hypothetical protein
VKQLIQEQDIWFLPALMPEIKEVNCAEKKVCFQESKERRNAKQLRSK